MHLPVAPACNLQCNYCNRKFDCSNESRPGVSSTLLTPEQAVVKVRQVAQAIPQLSVVGIAGPGDPLANIARTFRTLELIREQLPDLKLCLSTNGLMLPDAVDRLLDVGVDHVTVTINTLDAEIAAQIYAWLWLDGERYSGREAGEILIARQLEGVRRLTAQGVLVKINSVLIPGINDSGMADVSRALRASGAFIHNIMPLIARPEHGTVFGLNGQPEPDAETLAATRSRRSDAADDPLPPVPRRRHRDAWRRPQPAVYPASGPGEPPGLAANPPPARAAARQHCHPRRI